MTGDVPAVLAAVLARVRPTADCWVAYSGGSDSTALLHAAAALRGSLPGTLRAVHIDHGLHPDAPRWVAHCRERCRTLEIPLVVRSLGLRPSPGASIEAEARGARYGAFAELLGPGDLLLTGHHQDDQAETLLLALLRGSGVHGLAAMPSVCPLGRGRLVRPWLEVPRSDLADYVRTLGVSRVDDPGNAVLRMDRNYLRHRVIPVLRARWPAVSGTLARSARHCAEAARLVDRAAADRAAACRGVHPSTLRVRALAEMDRPQAKSLIRWWLRDLGFATPDTRHLARILDEVIPPGPNADPLVTWAGCEVRRYRGDLFAIAPLPPVPDRAPLHWVPAPWHGGEGSTLLALPGALGWLEWMESPEDPARQGLGTEPPSPSANGSADHRRCGSVTVRFGGSGRVCRTEPGHHSRSLKRLFQESGVPRWLRPYVPLLFVDESLVAVVGVRACRGGASARPSVTSLHWLGHPWTALGIFDRPDPVDQAGDRPLTDRGAEPAPPSTPLETSHDLGSTDTRRYR